MYRLALARGVGVGELLAALSPQEWAGWVAFHEAEPFGDRQADRRAAYQIGAWAGAGFKPEDCFPSLAAPRGVGPGGGAFRAWAAARCPALAGKPVPAPARAAH